MKFSKIIPSARSAIALAIAISCPVWAQSPPSPYPATGEIYWNASDRVWIDPSGRVCHSCSPFYGFPNPPVTQNGFFYLPSRSQWYDSAGRICNDCIPEKGFLILPQSYPPEHRILDCSNQVMGRYHTFHSDVAIEPPQDTAIPWSLRSTGRKGRCIFDSNNVFVRIEEDSN